MSLPLTKAHTDTLKSGGIPLVTVDAETPGAPRFVIDNVAGGRLAAEHLLALGHRRIGFVGDSGDQALAFSSTELRLRGYREALRDAQIAADRALVRITPHGAPRSTDGISSAEELIDDPHPPTAIFAVSDVQAMRVLHAVEQRGLRVPEELSLIGFDDIEAAGLVRLTTVRQPLQESGALAARRLCGLLAGKAERSGRTVLPIQVVERGSTARPRHREGLRLERGRRRVPKSARAGTPAVRGSAVGRARRTDLSPPPSGAARALPEPA